MVGIEEEASSEQGVGSQTHLQITVDGMVEVVVVVCTKTASGTVNGECATRRS